MNYNKFSIENSSTLIDALELMDESGHKLLIVNKEGKFHSLISIGDIQRAIVNGAPLDSSLMPHLRVNIKFARSTDNEKFIVDLMTKYRMDYCPILNSKNDIERIFFWDDIKRNLLVLKKNKIDLPVVIMAGGKGTRLKPLTNIIPKPMVPFGDKSMINVIIERFMDNGCKDFYISGNYMFDLLELHIKQLNLPVNIDIVKEIKPTGTGGSLALFKNKIKKPFIVSNCDILINDEYHKFVEYHNKNKNDITIISSIKTYNIPYGTIETTSKGLLKSISEKPKLNYQINTGFYILEPHIIDLVPEQKFIHITDIIELIKKNGGRIGVFPVSEKSWKDIGEWDLFLEQSNFK
ncbi:sugar phosphate nucleotidyltransferase [Akkermansiaceae bacterium]|nr:sugar phosphate nucleotidyltransferase [Akkermansiaceae bacterium]